MAHRKPTHSDDDAASVEHEAGLLRRIGEELSAPLADEEVEWLDADLVESTDWGPVDDWSD